jgi:glycosyltransferase involved in cell wall biosynthesis
VLKPNKSLEGPLVSIIVPAFNVEAFLSKCLQSICGQTYKDLEIIVVDDNSADSTGSILDSAAAADSRIKPIHLTDNVGLHRARAIGIEASIGSFIGVVDADDWIVSTMFETMLHRALKTDADITICGVTMVYPNGTLGHAKVRFSESQVFTTQLLQRFCHLRFGTGTLWNKLYKREIVKPYATMNINREVDSGADYIINIGCFAGATTVATVDQSFYRYLIRPESLSREGSEASHFIMIARAYAICLETYQSIFPQHLQLIDILYSKQLRFDCYYVADPEMLRPFRKHLIETVNRIMAVRPESLCTLVQYHKVVAGDQFRIWPRIKRRLTSFIGRRTNFAPDPQHTERSRF